MEYSALTASLAFAKAYLVLPHLIGGVGAVISVVNRKASPFVGPIGVVFVGAVAYVWTKDSIDSYHCRLAAVSNRGEWIEGEVGSVTRTYTRSGDGTIHFTIGGRKVSSRISGVNNDCGFIESLGKSGRIQEGEKASALVYDGTIVKFTSRRDG